MVAQSQTNPYIFISGPSGTQFVPDTTASSGWRWVGHPEALIDLGEDFLEEAGLQ